MSVLNPKRILTPLGKSTILSKLYAASGGGALTGTLAYLVTAVTVGSDGSTIEDVTLATNGMEVASEVTMSSAVMISDTGKTYQCSETITNTMTSPALEQTIIGVLLSEDGEASTAYAYLELEDPRTVDQVGENFVYAVEFGFDGQDFYLAPRVLPAGV